VREPDVLVAFAALLDESALTGEPLPVERMPGDSVRSGVVHAECSPEDKVAVVMVDRVDGVADAITTSRRASGIARQSVIAGMLMSFVAMGFAAFGYLPPVAGALLQEGIDVIVILNALRALRA